eukprot:gene17468-19215_t
MNNTSMIFTNSFCSLLCHISLANTNRSTLTPEDITGQWIFDVDNLTTTLEKVPFEGADRGIIQGEAACSGAVGAAFPIVSAASGIIGIIGNSFVVTAYVKQYKKLNPYRLLIMHLACCDLTTASVLLLWALATFLREQTRALWIFVEACAELVRFTSLITVTIIAIETYKAIQHPLRYNTETALKRIKKCLIATWIIALVLTILTSSSSLHCPRGSYCNFQMAMFYIPCVYTVFPLVIITFCYTMIIRKVRKKKPENGIFAGLSEDVAKKRQKSEMQMIKFLSLVVISSSLLLATKIATRALPLFMTNILCHKKINSTLTIVSLALPPYYMINNLIIYGMRDRKFLVGAFYKPKPKVDNNNPPQQQT